MEFLANWLGRGASRCCRRLRSFDCFTAHARTPVIGCAWWEFALVLAPPLVSQVSAFVWQEDAPGAIGAASPALVSLPHTPSSQTLIFAVWCVGWRVQRPARERDRENRADKKAFARISTRGRGPVMPLGAGERTGAHDAPGSFDDVSAAAVIGADRL